MYQEVAYVAYHFHWAKDEIEELPHKERHRWIEEISAINARINESSGGFSFAEEPDMSRPTFTAKEYAAHSQSSGPAVVNEMSFDDIWEEMHGGGDG